MMVSDPKRHNTDTRQRPTTRVGEFLDGRVGGLVSREKSVTPGGTANCGSKDISPRLPAADLETGRQDIQLLLSNDIRVACLHVTYLLVKPYVR